MNCKMKLNYKETGNRIWQLFEGSKKTVEEIAEFLDLSPRTVYYWFSGIKLPNLENLANLSKYFSINVEDILVLSS